MDLWKYSCIVFWCQNDALIHSGLILISLHFTFWPWHVTLKICFPSNKSHLTEQWIWWCSTGIRSLGRKKGYDHNRQMGADMTAASRSWSLDEMTLHNSTLEVHRKVHTRLPNWRKMGQVKADVYERHQFSSFRDYELTKSTYFPINLWLVSLGILGTRNGWESLNTMDSFVVVHIKKSNMLWGIRLDLEIVSKIIRVGQTIKEGIKTRIEAEPLKILIKTETRDDVTMNYSLVWCHWRSLVVVLACRWVDQFYIIFISN